MITNYKIVCLVQFNKIEFESSAILALSATLVLTSLVVPVELFRGKLLESDSGTMVLVPWYHGTMVPYSKREYATY